MDMNSIIRDNLGLVYKQIARLKLFDDPEAESIGYEALWTAAKTFDESKGYKFSTYATCCIYNALGSYIRTLNKKSRVETISYDNIAYTDMNGIQHNFLELLEDPNNVEDYLLNKELYAVLRYTIRSIYKNLQNPKHKAIVKEWLQHRCNITTKEIARRVGVSQPYVSFVLRIVRHQIKTKMEGYMYD